MKRILLCFFMFCVLIFTACSPVAKQAPKALPLNKKPIISEQYKAVWFSFFDFKDYFKQYSVNNEANFKLFFDNVLDNCKAKGFNRIIVHVRPFSDALYQSKYYPTSACIAGKQGGKLSYDPLKIMIQEAHEKGLFIEAWINPYRVTLKNDEYNYTLLSEDNPARKWLESDSVSDNRNVLEYDGKLYYNPSKKAVRKLIINGIEEIVTNYDIDGIHLDDYFYPIFSTDDHDTEFDAPEYYKSYEITKGYGIKEYRQKQVNTLVAGIKAAIKDIKPDVTFGISPAGNIDNLLSEYQYYVDIEKWCSSDRYVDYITPQIYWGFTNSYAQFDQVLNRWQSITDQSKVKLYVGLPAYRIGKDSGSNDEECEEFNTPDSLAKMIAYSRIQNVDGFTVFDYRNITDSTIAEYIDLMTDELKKQ